MFEPIFDEFAGRRGRNNGDYILVVLEDRSGAQRNSESPQGFSSPPPIFQDGVRHKVEHSDGSGGIFREFREVYI